MMNTQMNPGGLTDDELLRLARLLQQTRGEGLAFINQGEAQMLREAGGSGQPIPGTKGFGVGGGPIRSYIELDWEAEEKEGTTDETVETLTSLQEDKPDQGDFETRPEVIANRPVDTSGGDSGQQQQQTVTTKFKDQFGNEYNTQAEADTANATITQQRLAFQDYLKNNIKTDTDFETFKTQIMQQQEKQIPASSKQKVTGKRPETAQEYFRRVVGERMTDAAVAAAGLETFQSFIERKGLARPGGNVSPQYEAQAREQHEQELYKQAQDKGLLEEKFTYGPVTEATTEIVSVADGYEMLPESEIEKLFNAQKLLTVEAAKTQTKEYTDKVTNVLQGLTKTDAEGNSVPFTQQDLQNLTYEDVADQLAGEFGALSETTRRTIFQTMLNNAVRTERFSLTPEEVAEFARTAIQVDTTGISDATTPQITAPTEATAPKVGTVDEITAPTIKTVAEAEAVDVDEVTAPDRTIIEDVGNLNQEFLEEVRDGENELAEVLKKRISGEAKSPAEQQLRQATENNLRTLLSTTAGVIDPAKLRQVRNLYSETAQQLSGQAAELRSREQIDAEDRLVNLYAQQGTRELQIAMADLENDRQIAIEQGRLDQARKLAILEADLQRVITKATLKQNAEIANLRERAETARAQGNLDLQAEINNAINQRERVIAQLDADTRVEIENLNAAKDVAIAQGRIDVAIAIANLEKDVTLATTNADLALRSRALDDALALANYEGEMALEGIETKVELTELELDVKTKLAELGYETQEKIANLNAETQVLIANLNKQAARYAQDSAERAGIIDFIGTVIAMAIA